MNRRGKLVTLISLLLLISLSAAGQRTPAAKEPTKAEKEAAKAAEEAAKARAKALQQEQNTLRRWANEEVPYIITGDERDAYNKLKTDEERDQYIENFWLRRDYSTDSTENEFKDEYYARIAYANEHFASGIPGWKTDRGKIYIIHGPPDNTESHPSGGRYDRPPEEGGGTTSTFPFEKWWYRHLDDVGEGVELEFVDPTNSGEYRLTFDPSDKDALLNVPGAGLTEYEIANGLDKDSRLNRNTANPGNSLATPSRMSAFDRIQIFNDVQKPPEVKFKDLAAAVTVRLNYNQNQLQYGFRADYVRVTETGVRTPLTIQIANKNLTFQKEGNFQRATIRIYGTITDQLGRMVVPPFEETGLVDFHDSVFKEQFEKSSVYQNMPVLKPGLYILNLVVEDMNSKSMGVTQKRLQVPRFPQEGLAVSSLILADKMEALPPRQIASGQFVLGSTKVVPSVTGEFQRTQDLNVWTQAYGLKVDDVTHKPSATVEMTITRNGVQVKNIVQQSAEFENAAQQMTITKAIPLSDFEPGVYQLQMKLTDNLTKDIISTDVSKFTVK